jgi:NDP-sugar pyrophosphorylase family protein
VHHFADMVVDYLKRNSNFGLRIEISREEILLDTGGGLKKASWFFLEDPNRRDEPFILHNVDLVSTINLKGMVQFHGAHSALATLAVQERETSRYLLFDQHLQLSGRLSGRAQPAEFVRSSEELHAQALAFSGIHVISPRIFSMMTEEGAFSIITSYLRLAAQGENILSFRADNYYWRDLGRPENVAQAEKDLKNKVFS